MQYYVFHTWLQDYILKCNISLLGFQTMQAERFEEERKGESSGIAVLVNNRWWNPGHATVKHCFCSPDAELLAVCFCPYYLPREFTSVITVAVYIPSSAGADTACDFISSAVAKL